MLFRSFVCGVLEEAENLVFAEDAFGDREFDFGQFDGAANVAGQNFHYVAVSQKGFDGNQSTALGFGCVGLGDQGSCIGLQVVQS